MELRDITSPTGAEIEAYVNRAVQRLMASAPSGQASFRAQDYDIQCCRANHYPGIGWEYVGALGVGIDIIIVWRMSRVAQAERGIQSIMPLTGPTK